jgi:hypothetical protein
MLIETAREKADEVQWAVDISGRASALLLALLISHGQQVVYVPGRTVNRMTGAYRGEGKTGFHSEMDVPNPVDPGGGPVQRGVKPTGEVRRRVPTLRATNR